MNTTETNNPTTSTTSTGIPGTGTVNPTTTTNPTNSTNESTTTTNTTTTNQTTLKKPTPLKLAGGSSGGNVNYSRVHSTGYEFNNKFFGGVDPNALTNTNNNTVNPVNTVNTGLQNTNTTINNVDSEKKPKLNVNASTYIPKTPFGQKKPEDTIPLTPTPMNSTNETNINNSNIPNNSNITPPPTMMNTNTNPMMNNNNSTNNNNITMDPTKKFGNFNPNNNPNNKMNNTYLNNTQSGVGVVGNLMYPNNNYQNNMMMGQIPNNMGNMNNFQQQYNTYNSQKYGTNNNMMKSNVTNTTIPTTTTSSVSSSSNTLSKLNISNSKAFVPREFKSKINETTGTTGNETPNKKEEDTNPNTTSNNTDNKAFNFDNLNNLDANTSNNRATNNKSRKQSMSDTNLPTTTTTNNTNNTESTTNNNTVETPISSTKDEAKNLTNNNSPEKKKSKLGNLFSTDNKSNEPKTVVKTNTQNTSSKTVDKKNVPPSKAKFLEQKQILLEKQKLADESEKKEQEEKKRKEKEEREILSREIAKVKEEEEREERLRQEQIDKERKDLLLKEQKDKRDAEEREKAAKAVVLNRHYFVVSKDSSNVKNIMDIDYIMSFKNWAICKEDKLIEEGVRKYFKNFEKFEIEKVGYGNKKSYSGGSGFTKRQKAEPKEETQQNSNTNNNNFFARNQKIDLNKAPMMNSIKNTQNMNEANINASIMNDLEKWGRKDLSKYEKEADEQRAQILAAREEDPVKDSIIDLLNKMTVDNYQEVKKGIESIVKDSLESQKKLVEVLFKKALTEKTYVFLYAKLCKELDRDLTQKKETTDKDKLKEGSKAPSLFRSYVISKSQEVFKSDADENLHSYIKETDPEERANKMKKCILGNVNFITELIISRVLSKSVVFQCIGSLYTRIDKAGKDNVFESLINIEGIVILIDKFGTWINLIEKKLTDDALKEQNLKIDDKLERLRKIVEENTHLPGHIKFKVINLIEKKKNRWEQTEVEKLNKAKGIKEVKEEMNAEQNGGVQSTKKLTQHDVNLKIMQDLNRWKEHYGKGKKGNEYVWSIVGELTKSKVYFNDMLVGFLENTIDFVGKKADIEFAYTYIYELFRYYINDIKKYESEAVQKTIKSFYEVLSDMCLDNNFLPQIWGGVFYLSWYYGIMNVKSLDSIVENIDLEQSKFVFEALYFSKTEYCSIAEENQKMMVEINASVLKEKFGEKYIEVFGK